MRKYLDHFGYLSRYLDDLGDFFLVCAYTVTGFAGVYIGTYVLYVR